MSEEFKSFKEWQSPISLDNVFAQPGTPSFLELKNGCLYWMERNPELNGATNIKCRYAHGEVQTLTSAKLNVRTRANEYGGKAYCVGSDALYFCNDNDQRIYRLALNHDFSSDFNEEEVEDGFEESFGDLLDDDATIDQAQPITPDNGCMYADLCLSGDGKWLFFIMETPHKPENRTEVAVVSTQLGVSDPIVLASGCDFYASLVLSGNGKRLAWIEWRHPNMPWDETHVMIGDLESVPDNPVAAPKLARLSSNLDSVINGIGLGATVSHLAFEPQHADAEDGAYQRLFMTIDWPEQHPGSTKNFAQLYCWDGSALYEITQDRNEYSYPHWVYGNHRFVFLEPKKILSITTNEQGDELHLVDLKAEKISRLAKNFVRFTSVCAENGVAYVVAESQTTGPQVLRVKGTQVAVSPAEETLSTANVSCAESLIIIPEGSEKSRCNNYAFYYAPKNVAYSNNSPDNLPPLIVMVHGGPTARAQSHFDIQKQFWTTSGFAVLDVNHRGSTGFGRHYRDALLGEWGVADAQDIKSAIEYVLEKGMVHPDQVFIRGKSAGGYAVQRALTLYPELFAAGASYYGIGDLATLASVTHKFESRYCDQLLGEQFNAEDAAKEDSAYYQRSPIHALGNINCPMILFQGLDDKVVPQQLSQQVADVLASKFIEYEYHTYPGEGHGFRGLNAQVDSLTKELLFYRKQMTG
ncbi:MAG: alpha/beta hydrolase family protein [Arenicella sp.]